MTTDTHRPEGPYEHATSAPPQGSGSGFLPVAQNVWEPGQDAVTQIRLGGEVVAQVNWTSVWKKVFGHFGIQFDQPSPVPPGGGKLRVVPK